MFEMSFHITYTLKWRKDLNLKPATMKPNSLMLKWGKKFNVKQKMPYYLYQLSKLTIVKSNISDVRSLCKEKKKIVSGVPFRGLPERRASV